MVLDTHRRTVDLSAFPDLVVIYLGMWLPIHKDPAALERGVTRAGPTGTPHSAPTV